MISSCYLQCNFYEVFCSTDVQKNEWEINLCLRFNLCPWLSVSIMLIKLLCYQFSSLLTSVTSAIPILALSEKRLLLRGGPLLAPSEIWTRTVWGSAAFWHNNRAVSAQKARSGRAALATAALGAESLVCLCIDSSRVSQSDQSLNDIAWCLFIIIPTSDPLIKQEKRKKKNKKISYWGCTSGS